MIAMVRSSDEPHQASPSVDLAAYARSAALPRSLRQQAYGRDRVQVAPTARSDLIVWGNDDVYFPIKWAHWSAGTIPSAKVPVVLEGARLFIPEERPQTLNKLLRAHFAGPSAGNELNR